MENERKAETQYYIKRISRNREEIEERNLKQTRK
jgi:hypothetical protein